MSDDARSKINIAQEQNALPDTIAAVRERFAPLLHTELSLNALPALSAESTPDCWSNVPQQPL